MQKFRYIYFLSFLLMFSKDTMANNFNGVVNDQDPLTHYLANRTSLRPGEKVYRVQFDANGDGVNDVFLSDDGPESRSKYSIGFVTYVSISSNSFQLSFAGVQIYLGNKVRLKRNQQNKLCFYYDPAGKTSDLVKVYLSCDVNGKFERQHIRTLNLANPGDFVESFDNSADIAWAEEFSSTWDAEFPIETLDVENHPARRERTGPFIFEREYEKGPYSVGGFRGPFTEERPEGSETVFKDGFKFSNNQPTYEEVGFLNSEKGLMVLYTQEAYDHFKSFVHPEEAVVTYRPPNGKAGKDNSESNAAPVVDAKKPPANSNQPAVSKNDVNNTEANTSESDKKYGLILMLLAGAVLILMMIAFYRKSKKGV